MTRYKQSDLLLNSDGSIFHLKLKPGHVARNIILVGDPDRVGLVSSHFSSIELKAQNREFVTHTGVYREMPVSVISTGIGTDNIDIVLTEIDALFNIDLISRELKSQICPLNFIRIGTSGALQKEIEPGSYLFSSKAIGFDGLMNFYSGIRELSDQEFENALTDHLKWDQRLATPYVVEASEVLERHFEEPDIIKGVTISSPGFYGPQGRSLRMKPVFENLVDLIETFHYNHQKITNFEMESSAIYGMSRLLGHQAATICAIIANRITGSYLSDYGTIMSGLIEYALNKLVELRT